VIRYIVVSWEPKPLGPKEIEAAEIAAEDAAAAEYAAAQDAAAAEYEASVAAAAAEATAGEAVAEAETADAVADAEPAAGVVIEAASDVAEEAPAEATETGEARGLVTPVAGETASDERPVPTGAVRPDADGACPADNPIKGNLSSMYYHAPGTRFYDRTVPEYCFDTVESAEAAGFGPTKEETVAEAAAE
jgi:large subunit ribosomal protein L4